MGKLVMWIKLITCTCFPGVCFWGCVVDIIWISSCGPKIFIYVIFLMIQDWAGSFACRGSLNYWWNVASCCGMVIISLNMFSNYTTELAGFCWWGGQFVTLRSWVHYRHWENLEKEIPLSHPFFQKQYFMFLACKSWTDQFAKNSGSCLGFIVVCVCVFWGWGFRCGLLYLRKTKRLFTDGLMSYSSYPNTVVKHLTMPK